MLTGCYQSILILLVVLAFYVPDTYFHRRYGRRRSDDRGSRSLLVNLFFGAISLFFLAQPCLFPGLNWYLDGGWLVQLIGGVFLLSSTALNIWARLHLAHLYSQRSEVQEYHHLVNTGPYRYVRHPLFIAYFAFVLSMLCFNPGIPSAALFIGTCIYLLILTFQDERVLVDGLPSYSDYMRRTPRYLPTTEDNK